MNKPDPAVILKAIRKAGGRDKVSREMGLEWPNTVGNWPRIVVPEGCVIKLCKMTGGEFQPYQIRPDKFDENQRVEVVK